MTPYNIAEIKQNVTIYNTPTIFTTKLAKTFS